MGDHPRDAGDDKKGVADLGRNAEVAEERGDGPIDVDRKSFSHLFSQSFLDGTGDPDVLSGQAKLFGQRKELDCPRIFRVEPMAEARGPLALGLHFVKDVFDHLLFVGAGLGRPLRDLHKKPLAFLDSAAG